MAEEGAPVYSVTYWNTRAIGEYVRLALAVIGEPWEDIRLQVGPPPQYDKSVWLDAKHSSGLALPNLPFLEDVSAGIKLTQTHAILRYLARKHGLEAVENVHVGDAVLEGARDWMSALFDVTYCDLPGSEGADTGCHRRGSEEALVSERFLAKKEAYLEHRCPQMAKDMDAAVVGPFVTGTSWCFVDLVLFEVVDQHILFTKGREFLASCPKLAACVDAVAALPKVAAYRASTRFKAEPVHNRYSHFHTGCQ